MFDAFQLQFQLNVETPVDLAHPFLEALPNCAPRSFAPFLVAGLKEALSTCSTTSAPGPSHMSWSLLKMFLADKAFHAQFLQLANNVITSETWPSAFKSSTMVVIPKLHKDDYMQAKNFQPTALLECMGKLVSKLIAA